MKNYLILLLLVISSLSFSQTNNQNETLKYGHKLTLGSDLFQPIFLGGFNLNVTYTANRFVFDYSHGVSCCSKVTFYRETDCYFGPQTWKFAKCTDDDDGPSENLG